MPKMDPQPKTKTTAEHLGQLLVGAGGYVVARVLQYRSSPAELRQPGVVEILDALGDDGPALRSLGMEALIDRDSFASFALWTRNNALTDAAIRVLSGDQDYDDVIRDGIFERARHWIHEYARGEPLFSATKLWLAVADLHCPAPEGCSAKYDLTRSVSLAVTAKGVGGGAGLTKTVTFKDSFETAGRCIRIAAPVKVKVTPWQHRTTLAVRYLVSVEALADQLRPFVEGDHACGPNFVRENRRLHAAVGSPIPPGSVPYPLTPLSGVTQTKEVKSRTAFQFTNGLKIQELSSELAVPSDLAVEVKSKFSKEVTVSVALAGGHDYLRFGPGPEELRFWAWTP